MLLAPSARAVSLTLFIALLALDIVVPVAPPVRAQTGCTPVAEPIAPGQTLQSDLDPEDCIHDEQTEARYDVYVFTAAAGTEYTIGMAAEWLDPALVVRDSSNALVVADDDGGIGENARTHFTAAASGEYRIEATSSGFGIGPYEISLAEGPCPPAAAPIAPGQSVAGRLTDADCVSAVQPDSYYDAYALTATAGTEYTISLTSVDDPEGYFYGIDPLLVLRDPAGAVLLTDDDGGIGWNARIDVTAAASGLYTIEATNADVWTGTYRLEVRAGGCPPVPTPIAIGQTKDGQISEVDCPSEARAEHLYDAFSFTAAAGDQVRVVMSRADLSDGFGSNLDPYLVVRGPSGAILAEDDNSAGLSNASVLMTAPSAGTYTIEATGAEAGPYTLSLAGVMCPAVPVAVSPGQQLSGALEPSDCFSLYEPGAYADVWSFTGSPGQQYTLTVDPQAEIGVRVNLRNPAGTVVAQGYGQFGGAPSIVHSAQAAGTYTFEVAGGDPGATSPYTVSLAVAACPSAPISLPVGQTVSGSLATTDCLGGTRQNAYYDRYSFQAATGRVYTVRVLASGFDPAIAGINVGGYSIFCCEPTGQRTFRIQPPANGPIVVEVTSYSGIGNYTVRVDEAVCTSANQPISVGQTVDGALSASDCFIVHPHFAAAQHHQDTYTFEAVAGEAYQISLSSSAYYPYFRLTTPSGATVVERGDNFVNDLTYTYTAGVTGTHTLEVSSELARWTGPYTLSLAAGVACSSGSGTVAAGQSLSGSLDATDCYNATPWYLTGSHYDRYTIDMQAGARYTIEVDTTEIEPFIMLRNPAGAVVADGADYSPGGSGFPDRYAQVLYTPQTSGTYTIDVSSEVAGDTGAYTLSVASNAGCNGAAVPVTIGEIVSGTLETSDCDSTIRPFSYRDHFTFSGSAGQRVKLAMTAQAFDAYLGIFGPGGQLLGVDDDSGIGSDARLVVTLPATGTYTVEATGFWPNTTGAYQIRFEPDGGGGACTSAATPIEVGATLSGTLAGTECPAVSRPQSYHDGYTFFAEAGTTYAISMVALQFDSYLAVVDASGTVLVENDDGGYGLNAFVEFTPAADGVFKIEATSDTPDTIGSYFVTLLANTGGASCTPLAVPLALGQTISGTLTIEDCESEFQTGSYHDRFAIQVQAGVTYRLLMESSAVDPWLVLVDSSGDALMQGDDTDDGTANAEIVFTAPATETFTIETTTASPDEVGPYTISLAEAEPPPSDEAASRGVVAGCAGRTLKIVPGRKLANSLAATDCLAPERPTSHHNRYELRAVAGVAYTVTMRSTELDARLVLVGPSGAVAAEDDNGGGKLDARVTFTPPADSVYTLVATTTRAVQLGRYEIAVSGRSDETAGVYVPSVGTWFLRNANSGGAADAAFGYGPTGPDWVPLAGDWDGDGRDTVGLYNTATGIFFLRNANAPGAADLVFGYGPTGSSIVPLVGDWNGDGIDTVGIYHSGTGFFFLRNTNTPGPADVVFSFGPGGLGWVPLAGDWNGDGRDTAGVYSPATGAFFLRNQNASGNADVVFQFGPGGAGFQPLVGDWNADGIATVGLYAPSTASFFLRNAHAGGNADRVFTYGPANARPLVGNWDGR